MDEQIEPEQEETYESVRTSRSGRAVRPPVKYGIYQMLMLWTSNKQREKQEWQLLISSIHDTTPEKVPIMLAEDEVRVFGSIVMQFSWKEGLRCFGEQGEVSRQGECH